MADEIKRISVRIGGMSYQLVSAENETYTRQIAAKADEMIRRVMQNNPQLSLNMSSVLALVNSPGRTGRVFRRLNALESQQAKPTSRLRAPQRTAAHCVSRTGK